MDEKLFEQALSLKRDIDRVDMDIIQLDEKIKDIKDTSDNFFFQVSLPSRYKEHVADLLRREKTHLEIIKIDFEKEFKEL